MTDKKMTDAEFRDAMLSSLTELHEQLMGFNDDLDVLKIACIIMANMNSVNFTDLLKQAKRIHTLNALENLAEKGQ